MLRSLDQVRMSGGTANVLDAATFTGGAAVAPAASLAVIVIWPACASGMTNTHWPVLSVR